MRNIFIIAFILISASIKAQTPVIDFTNQEEYPIDFTDPEEVLIISQIKELKLLEQHLQELVNIIGGDYPTEIVEIDYSNVHYEIDLEAVTKVLNILDGALDNELDIEAVMELSESEILDEALGEIDALQILSDIDDYKDLSTIGELGDVSDTEIQDEMRKWGVQFDESNPNFSSFADQEYENFGSGIGDLLGSIFGSGIPVMDLAHVNKSKKIEKQLDEQHEELSIESILAYMNSINAEKINKIEHDTDERMRKANTVRDVNFSDFLEEFIDVEEFQFGYQNWVSEIKFMERLKDDFSDLSNTENAKSLYGKLTNSIEFQLGDNIYYFHEEQQKKALNKYVVNESSDKKMLELVLKREYSKDLLENAQELKSSVMHEYFKKFHMSSYERLNITNKATEYLYEAMENEIDASEEMVNSFRYDNPSSKNIAVSFYKNMLLRKYLEESKFYTYGED
ncbi:hypothetical protein [Chondrinema litorale]|uniref:hypothetical protein n=1 Tax=Chondrinema litorale TaxID=2994555 RepID=UPI002542CCBC|nr:hypothetical protein [Chondrinema litorale]UZS00068.1 hypothetical protein OQ292_39705 [Chondrinema litorale]